MPDVYIWFFVIFSWTVISSIYSFILSQKDEIVVFYDFTDATMSFLAFLVPIAIIFLGNQIGINTSITNIVSLAVFAYMLWKMSSVVNILNPSKSFFQKFMILSSKLLLPILLILEFMPSENKRRDKESKDEYERRLERENKRDAIWIAALTGAIFLMIKNNTFSSFSKWFNIKENLDLIETGTSTEKSKPNEH